MTCLIFNVITVLHGEYGSDTCGKGRPGTRGSFNCIAFSGNIIHCQGGVG